jgi:ABC-type antimicrobial peptide transport system permease subunit
MNTMLMATYERIHEFGVLKALGASPWRIIRDVTVEALLMALLATVLGTILGVAGSYYLQVVGLDTSAFTTAEISFAGVAFDPLWRATLNAKVVTRPVVVMWIICLIASLYPAAMAARLDPVQAMTHV